MKKSRFLGALVVLALHSVSNQALAQCGVTMSCEGENDPTSGACQIQVCFKDSESKRQYEEEHNCKFPSGAMCNGKEIDEETQCCGKNAETGEDEIQDKQIRVLDNDFNWETKQRYFDWNAYQEKCPDMRQSEGKADDLWAQCVVGERHSNDDAWPVTEVLSNPDNPKARTYCIDGCSTPPFFVNRLHVAGVFIYKDKDNPIGGGKDGFGKEASFYDACRQHDICYQTCTSTDREACDDQMLRGMEDACSHIPEDHITTFANRDDENTRELCRAAAKTMYNGLRFGGGDAFNHRKQQYCQCC